MLHHDGPASRKPPRPFRPTGKGGGSKKGKPQWRWPLVIVMVADALAVRAKGSEEALAADRNWPFTPEEFIRLMEAHLPGVWEYLEVAMGYRKTAKWRLLKNRVYKMYYSGTSDRGTRHDPWTRACESGEHWRKKIPHNHKLAALHDKIRRGLIPSVPKWEKYLWCENSDGGRSAAAGGAE